MATDFAAPSPISVDCRRNALKPRFRIASTNRDISTLSAATIVADVERHGGVFVIVDGRLFLRRRTNVPAELVEAIRARKDAVLALIAARSLSSDVQTTVFAVPALPTKIDRTRTLSFLDRQERLFAALLAEYREVRP